MLKKLDILQNKLDLLIDRAGGNFSPDIIEEMSHHDDMAIVVQKMEAKYGKEALERKVRKQKRHFKEQK